MRAKDAQTVHDDFVQLGASCEPVDDIAALTPIDAQIQKGHDAAVAAGAECSATAHRRVLEKRFKPTETTMFSHPWSRAADEERYRMKTVTNDPDWKRLSDPKTVLKACLLAPSGGGTAITKAMAAAKPLDALELGRLSKAIHDGHLLEAYGIKRREP